LWRQLLPHMLAATDPTRHLDDVTLEVGWLLNHAASYLQARGEPRVARALFEDAYDLYRRRLGPDHPDTLASARTLVQDLHALGQHEQAHRFLHDANLDQP
jgi:Tetratricopeptide repeat